MNDQLVNINTAILAKEKGFNIRTDYRFDRNNEITQTPSLKYAMSPEGSKRLLKPCDFLFAPTQTTLQKWLREEYAICVYVVPFLSKLPRKEQCHIWYKGDTISLPPKNIYEESLEEGLYKALQLI